MPEYPSEWVAVVERAISAIGAYPSALQGSGRKRSDAYMILDHVVPLISADIERDLRAMLEQAALDRPAETLLPLISHEINQLLTEIINEAEKLVETSKDTDRMNAAGTLADILDEVRHNRGGDTT